eukprot:15365361-Ditylum_brightwellii.AAC.1
MAFTMPLNASDTPNQYQAMNRPDSEGNRDAMDMEVGTLKDMKSWDIVPHTKVMNILAGTWPFKCKRFPYGRVKKLKTRPCVQDVYGEMPRGYRKDGHVSKLQRCLYGLRQILKNFFKHLGDTLPDFGMPQCQFESYILATAHVIFLVYIDDCLFFAKDDKYIQELLSKIDNKGLKFTLEEDAAGFLGVSLNKIAGKIQLLQTSLIDKIVETLGQQVAESAFTPAEMQCFGKN